jgi:hypothetical protein
MEVCEKENPTWFAMAVYTSQLLATLLMSLRHRKVGGR